MNKVVHNWPPFGYTTAYSSHRSSMRNREQVEYRCELKNSKSGLVLNGFGTTELESLQDACRFLPTHAPWQRALS